MTSSQFDLASHKKKIRGSGAMKLRPGRRSLTVISTVALGCALAVPGAAFAQGEPEETPEGPEGQPDGTAAESDSPFNVIMVTAERREQSLQDSSLALQVLTAEELDRANLTQIHDLNTL